MPHDMKRRPGAPAGAETPALDRLSGRPAGADAGGSKSRNVWRLLLTSALASCVLSGPVTWIPTAPPAYAGAPPWRDVSVSITAREQPIESFLQSLFAQSDLSVSISPAVRGNVSGVFQGKASDVFRDVARSFDLVTYYDGVVVHVYRSSEITTRVFPVMPTVGGRVIETTSQLRLSDRYNRVQLNGDQVLVATGTQRFVDQVTELVRAQSASAGEALPLEYRVFYLRYGWADDTTLTMANREMRVPGVATLLRNIMARDEEGVEQIESQQPGPSQRREGLRRGEVAAENGDGAGAGAQAIANQSPAQGAGPFNNEPTYARVGWPSATRITADRRLNAIIVRDVRERMPAYEQLIRALDVEPQLLQIEATIIDIDTDRMRELGLNWRWDNGRDSVLFGRGDASDRRLRPNREVTPQGRGLFISGVLGDSNTFTARLNALEARGLAKIVARPQVLTLSNIEAVFDNSQTFFVRLTGEREVDLFDVTTGTSLRVTPTVSQENGQTRIRLWVAIQDGSITGQRVDTIPVVERSGITTQALINEGESLLIGGLVVEREEEARDQIPILGDVPVVGRLFRSDTRRTARAERLFLISPRLASPGGSLGPPRAAPPSPPAQGAPSSSSPSGQGAQPSHAGRSAAPAPTMQASSSAPSTPPQPAVQRSLAPPQQGVTFPPPAQVTQTSRTLQSAPPAPRAQEAQPSRASQSAPWPAGQRPPRVGQTQGATFPPPAQGASLPPLKHGPAE